MKQIIDTSEFQRLRDIKQLGIASMVFPSATHTRFEHSIGVSHLAGLMVQHLRNEHPELKITDRSIELFRIAGLLHDLGHAPFSHMFDNHIVPNLDKKYFQNDPHFALEHEERSCLILEQMVLKYNLAISKKELNFIKRLIVPQKEDTTWEYQIIANQVNDIDVDKIDYIQRDSFHLNLGYAGQYTRILELGRVIDKQLCYPKKLKFEIYSLFHTRFRLHKEIYNHPVSKAYEFMFTELFCETMKEYPDVKFIDLTESLILARYKRSPASASIIKQIDQRQHPKLLEEYVGIKKINDFTNKTNLIKHYKIGFVGKNKTHPLNSVWFYSTKNKNNKYKIDLNQISPIISQTYFEHGVRIYS